MGAAFLQPGSIAAIRNAASGLFWDQVTVLKRSASDTGAYAHLQERFGDYDTEHPELEIETACKFNPVSASELNHPTDEQQTNATVLFPASLTGVDAHDRFRLDEKFGTALETPELYEIVGPLRETIFGYEADLRRVEDRA